jgi:hypothetical protein
MIKMSARDDRTGRGVIIFGITEDNIRALKAGSPIHVTADELGFTGDIIIDYESTLDRLMKKFKQFIGPNTHLSDTTGQKRN